MKRKLNAFEQLVEWLDTGKISYIMLIIAFKTHIKNTKEIPSEVKDIICGENQKVGIVHPIFRLLFNVISYIELAYRRGEGFHNEIKSEADNGQRKSD